MTNIENVKKLVSALSAINHDIERKREGSFMTPMQVKATEDTLYKISGIKVKVNNIRDFKELERYYRDKYLYKNNNVYLEEGWIRAEKGINDYPNGTKYRAIMGGYWIKIGDRKFKWCTGATFPRVGGDWNGEVMLPK